MANFEQISQECGNFSLRILLLQQLETYDSESGSGWNIVTPAEVDSGTPVGVHLWLGDHKRAKAHRAMASHCYSTAFVWLS